MFTKLCALVAKKNRGFTLIELIVVIAILGILIAILVPSMIGFINSSREAAVRASGKTIFTAGQAYLTQQNHVLGNDIDTFDYDDLIGADLLANTPPGAISGLVVDDNGVITSMTYTENGIDVTFPLADED